MEFGQVVGGSRNRSINFDQVRHPPLCFDSCSNYRPLKFHLRPEAEYAADVSSIAAARSRGGFSNQGGPIRGVQNCVERTVLQPPLKVGEDRRDSSGPANVDSNLAYHQVELDVKFPQHGRTSSSPVPVDSIGPSEYLHKTARAYRQGQSIRFVHDVDGQRLFNDLHNEHAGSWRARRRRDFKETGSDADHQIGDEDLRCSRRRLVQKRFELVRGEVGADYGSGIRYTEEDLSSVRVGESGDCLPRSVVAEVGDGGNVLRLPSLGTKTVNIRPQGGRIRSELPVPQPFSVRRPSEHRNHFLGWAHEPVPLNLFGKQLRAGSGVLRMTESTGKGSSLEPDTVRRDDLVRPDNGLPESAVGLGISSDRFRDYRVLSTRHRRRSEVPFFIRKHFKILLQYVAADVYQDVIPCDKSGDWTGALVAQVINYQGWFSFYPSSIRVQIEDAGLPTELPITHREGFSHLFQEGAATFKEGDATPQTLAEFRGSMTQPFLLCRLVHEDQEVQRYRGGSCAKPSHIWPWVVRVNATLEPGDDKRQPFPISRKFEIGRPPADKTVPPMVKDEWKGKYREIPIAVYPRTEPLTGKRRNW
jgi:hypothetical protein